MTSAVVSVVIPAYDRPDALADAVESVRKQTYDPVELIVIDDCSPRLVEPILADLDLASFVDVRCIRHDENRGASMARTTGMDAATGEYVAFLDDDDRWAARKIAMQVSALQDSGRDAGVAYTGMRIVDGDGTTVRTHTPSASGNLTRTLLCRNVVGSYSTVLVRREAIEDVGPPDPEFPTWQDLEWYVRLSVDWDFVAVSKPLTIIRQDEDHDQLSDDFETISTASYPLFLEKFRPLAAEYGPWFERKMRGWAAFRVGAYNALRTGQFRPARRYLLRAVRLYPIEPTFWAYLAVAFGGRPTYRAAKRVKRALFD